MQLAKIIDIKRSFVPIDPNAFPENYHTTQKEDQPDEAPPVIPYMGANILPTSYGYKSFFGTNFKAAVDALPVGVEAEHVFLYQNLAYSNTLIALTNLGIYAKLATTNGAWVQLVALAAPAAGIYYEWFFEIIKNKLYAFRGNGDAYYVIETDIAQPVGVSIATVVPTFITPNAQLGMFRLGGRLGFWDAENAVAWSSPDDLAEFTPSALTGANVTTFNSITGKISAIRAHGRHAIVYASKSITFLNIQPSDSFLVKAEPLIDAGVPYNRQSVVSSPSTMHFCCATTGIYKIENGKAEPIIPEVFDFLKGHTQQPIYLKLINNRFLCFEILDPDLANGIPHFSNVYYPTASLTFPGSTTLEGYASIDAEKINFCELMPLIDDGALDDMQPSEASTPDKMPGTKATPIWTCYLSNNGVKELSNLTFENVPCGGTNIDGTEQWPMSPVGALKVSGLTTDSTGKTQSAGTDAWVDGKWTMERFLATQSAIWKMEEQAIAEVLDRTLAQAFFDTKITTDSSSCVPSSPAPTYCQLGDFVSKFSDHKFGYNTCSFWLTRFVIESKTIAAKTTNLTTCTTAGTTDSPLSPHFELWNDGVRWTDNGANSGQFAAESDAIAAFSAASGGANLYLDWSVNPPVPQASGDGATSSTNGVAALRRVSDNANVAELKAVYTNPSPATRTFVHADAATYTGGAWPVIVSQYKASYSTITQTKSAANEVQSTNVGILGVETAHCEITGWSYTKKDGTTAEVPATACNNTQNNYPKSPVSPGYRTADPETAQMSVVLDDNSVCDVPFTPPLSPALNWPEETVTYPAIDFLFQDGSIAPRWPTVYGFFCYDLQLKKWGKHVGAYKQLLDYLPINSDSQAPVVTDNQGMLAGVLKDDGFLYLFDNAPLDSYLTWGKIGYYRKGVTDAQEVTFNFADNATGSVVVDLSIDGKHIIEEASYEVSHANVRQVTVYPPYSGKWYNVTIKGKFDISDLVFIGHIKGRR